MDLDAPQFQTPEAFAAYLVEHDHAEVPEELLRFAMPADEESAVDLAEIEAGGDAPKQRRFAIQANSGKPFLHWLWGNFAVDLEGVEIPRQKMGVLDSHSPNRRLGFTDSIRLDKRKGLMAEGGFLTNQYAAEILADADDGFPFEASVYVPPKTIERVEAGAKTKVNGYTFHGPGHIFRTSTLREVSIASLGADHRTSAVALSEGRAVSVPRPEGERSMAKQQSQTDDEKGTPAAEQLTAESLKQNHPDLFREIQASGFKAGVNSERERVGEILAECHGRQLPLAQQLVKDGADAKSAFRELLREASAFKSKKQTEIRDGSDDTPSGDDPRPRGGDTETGKTPAGLSVEDQAALDWDSDPKIRAEFTDKGSYLAYLRATSADLVQRPKARD